MKRYRGQGLAEYAVLLLIVGVMVLIGMCMLTDSLAGQEMTRRAAESAAQLEATISQHAEAKHGTEAVAVKDCLINRGTYATWVNPTNHRIANVCQLEDGRFGVDITEANSNPVTTFIKNKMNEWQQVAQYLRNSGYQPLQ